MASPMIPIFINVFERLTYTRILVERLHELGVDERLVLIDNGSTYEPLRDWLAGCGYPVIRLEENLGPYVGDILRISGELYKYASVRANEHIAYTDPDVVPCAECPPDFLEVWRTLLDSTPNIAQVGFALRIDDLPDAYPLKQRVIDVESIFWQSATNTSTSNMAIYHSAIDTTFALVRAENSFGFHENSLRTGPPYWARHMTWYETPCTLFDDIDHYRMRIADNDISWWSKYKFY